MQEDANHKHHWTRINKCEKRRFASIGDRLRHYGKVVVFFLTAGLAFPTIFSD